MATNTINIILSISDEDRARIDTLISRFATVRTETFTKVDPELPKEAKKAEPLTKTEAMPQHTIADVQQKVVALCANGKKAEVRAIISAYAERVSLIPAEKADEIIAKLTALED